MFQLLVCNVKHAVFIQVTSLWESYCGCQRCNDKNSAAFRYLCASSLRKGHAYLPWLVPVWTDVAKARDSTIHHVDMCCISHVDVHFDNLLLSVQVRAMHGQAPIQKLDFSVQPQCKVSHSSIKSCLCLAVMAFMSWSSCHYLRVVSLPLPLLLDCVILSGLIIPFHLLLVLEISQLQLA